jgi:hypothetical protein
MWEAHIIDTRDQGAMSLLMDGFIHIVPRVAVYNHVLNIKCWCDPRILWLEEAGTCLVSHKHLKAPRHV